MIDQINDLLAKLCYKLSNSSLFGQGAYNYAVDVKLFDKKVKPDFDEIELIESLIPKSIVGNIEKSNLSEIVDSVKECFEFSGDEGSFPNKKYLVSEEFADDLAQLLEHLKILFFENLGITKFWLEDGHPFYSVYWDYAFLVKKNDSYFVLIGSSSD